MQQLSLIDGENGSTRGESARDAVPFGTNELEEEAFISDEEESKESSGRVSKTSFC